MTISCATLPAAVVEQVRDAAERAQVRLGGLELAERDRRERRVLAVGGEQPRVVRVAGAEERRARDRAVRSSGRPCPGRRSAPSRSGRALRQVGEVLLAPVDGLLQPAVAGQVDDRARGELVAVVALGAQLGVGVLQRGVELAAGVVEAAIGARDRDPDRLDARARRSSRGSAAGRRRPCRAGRRRRRWAATRVASGQTVPDCGPRKPAPVSPASGARLEPTSAA